MPSAVSGSQSLRLVSAALDALESIPAWSGVTNSPASSDLDAAPSAHCAVKAGRRLDYTHRKVRKGELKTLALRDAVRGVATRTWESAYRLAEGFRVVGAPPVCLTPGVNLSQPFGSWHVAYFEQAAILGGLVEAKPPQVLEVEPTPYVGVFAPGMSSHGHTISCSGTVVTAGGCLWEFRAPSPLPWSARREHMVVTLCDEWCKGYYHFSHEHLPRVAFVYDRLAAGDATLALSHRMNTFQRQFFVDILRIPKIIEGGTVVANLTLHPTPMRCGNTFTLELHYFRSIVFRQLQLQRPAATSPIRLLFAERGRGSRMASNYDAIKKAVTELLKQRGVAFSTTRGTEHAKDQVALFHAADVVLGPHGANLANAMYMRRGGHLIEMASMMKGNMCYYSTALRVGLTFHFIPHLKGKDDPYTLDPALVVRHVDLAINATQQNRDALRKGAGLL